MGDKITTKEIKSIFDISGVPSFRDFYNKYIALWKRIYRGNVAEWHEVVAPTINNVNNKRKRERLGVAKAVCSELAGLIWAEKCDVNVTTKGFVADANNPDKLGAFVQSVLAANNFKVKMREHIEQTLALSGGTLKTWGDIKKNADGSDIEGSEAVRISYGLADQFIPLAWTNADVTEGVFISRQVKGAYSYTTLEFHQWSGAEYIVRNELYRRKLDSVSSRNELDELGDRVPLSELYDNLTEEVPIKGLQRSLFSYYHPNIANNINDNSPLGISIYANALSTLKALDICYDSFVREFVLGKKRIIVPASAIRYVNDPVTGKRERYFDADDEVYEAMDSGDLDSLTVKDNTIELRVEEHEAAINAFLGILSFQLGLSAGSLTFDKVEGLKTATEVISEKSKTFKTVKQHQEPIQAAIEKLVHNIIDVARLYGIKYEGVKIATLAAKGYEVSVYFDDAIIQDRQTDINEGILLVTNDLMSKGRFMRDKLGYTQQDAEAELKAIAQEKRGNAEELDMSLYGTWGK
jgi:A118 family predicted phage portal protein